MSYYIELQDEIAGQAEALEALRAWVRDLRSGNFQQGEAVLHDLNRDTHCCVGVLCETQFSRFKTTPSQRLLEGGAVDFIAYFNNYDDDEEPNGYSVPAQVAGWFVNRGIVVDWYELYDMNDGSGDDHRTFEQIADHIEGKYIRPLEAQIG